MRNPFYTIGHSTRPIAEFIGMLQSVDATWSSTSEASHAREQNSQYNQNVLPQSLSSFQIGYEHIAALGGLRSKDHGVPPSINASSGRLRAFTTTPTTPWAKAFTPGSPTCGALGARRRCAIMCSEALWWRCHRPIITDYLLVAGVTVFHLIRPEQVEPARINEAARLQPAGVLTYPAEPTSR